MTKDQFKKRWPVIFFGTLFVVFLGLRIQQYFFPHQAEVAIGGTTVRVLVADTDVLRHKGLSERKDWGNYGGMLFIFDQPDYYTFVMRKMLFPLDIVWINGNMVVDSKQNLPPEFDRAESDLTRYVSRVPANKVLELPAGFVAAHGVKVGDTAVFTR